MAVLFSAVRLMAEQNKEVDDMNDWDRLHRQAQRYKETYPPGTRIMLLSMGNDPNPVESGTRGTVRVVDDIGTLHCDFDNCLPVRCRRAREPLRRAASSQHPVQPQLVCVSWCDPTPTAFEQDDSEPA